MQKVLKALGLFLILGLIIAKILYWLIKVNFGFMKHFGRYTTKVSRNAGYKKYHKIVESRLGDLSTTVSNEVMING